MRQTLRQMRWSVHAELTEKTPEEGSAGNVPFFDDGVIKAIPSDSRASSRRSWLAIGSTEHDESRMPHNTMTHDNMCRKSTTFYRDSRQDRFLESRTLSRLYNPDLLETLLENKRHGGGC